MSFNVIIGLTRTDSAYCSVLGPLDSDRQGHARSACPISNDAGTPFSMIILSFLSTHRRGTGKEVNVSKGLLFWEVED